MRLPKNVLLLTLPALALGIGPFLLPQREDGKSPRELAGEDSQFIHINGLEVHYKRAGERQPALVMLHGFGASLFTWREISGPLAETTTVLAFDRPAFGLTSRPLPGEWTGANPYSPEAQTALVINLINQLELDDVVLVGHSAGGNIAALTALRYPDRFSGLILIDPAIYSGGGAPAWIRPLLAAPQMRRLGPWVLDNTDILGGAGLRLAWHNPAKVTEDILAGYTAPAQAKNWSRALWEFTVASRTPTVASQLNKLQLPALVISGEHDRLVPIANSQRLARELPNAEFASIPDSGHIPHEEQPAAVVEAMRTFLAKLARK